MLQKNWTELIKPNKLDIQGGSNPNRFAQVVAEPLERGFGLTLGNALRRILLSSLQGAAVTSIQIDGVLHEFSSIPGVREDVTDIVLNLKALGIKLHGEHARRMHLKAEGPCLVTAGMIEASVKNADNGVEISKQVGEVLDQIANGNRKVNDLVAEIAGASNEQAQGIEQINTAVGQMDSVTQSAAASAEESASAAQELSAQAEELRKMIQDLEAIVGGSGGSSGASDAEKARFVADVEESSGRGYGGRRPVDAHAATPDSQRREAEAAIPFEEGKASDKLSGF